MLGGGRAPSRGRGSSRGRGFRQKRGDSDSTAQGVSGPYRQVAGRGSVQPRKRTGSGAAPATRERSGPSQKVLAHAAAIRETASRFARDEGSSESEEEEVEGREVVERLLKNYYQDLGSDGGEGMDGEVLKATMTAAGGSCLVCLSSIKRTDAVWSCSQCYCLFHLQCIQQWARDGERQLSLLSPELFPGQEVLWSCPKCRLEYPMNQFPKTYFCFCGKYVHISDFSPPSLPFPLISHRLSGFSFAVSHHRFSSLSRIIKCE
jgi:hypothetical protein